MSTENFTKKKFFFQCLDGWTKSDLVYSWYDNGPVQIPGNLSLPGGFKLGGYGNQYCDVITATGNPRQTGTQGIIIIFATFIKNLKIEVKTFFGWIFLGPFQVSLL